MRGIGGSLKATWALSAVYVALYLAAYYSFACGPLLLVALTPFAVAVCGATKGGAASAVITFASFLLWFFGNLFFATYNWAALLALTLLHALIIGLSAIALRWLHKTTKLPLALLLPVTFVAGEFIRLAGPLGIPTGILSLGLHRHLWIIQVADLGGSYLVSFAIAAVSGAIADVWLQGWSRSLWRSVLPVALGWVAIASYGSYRLAQARHTMRAGPTIGVVQSDIPMTGNVSLGYDRERFLHEMLALSDQSAATQPKPSLVVWPESMDVLPPLNSEWLTAKQVSGELLRTSQAFDSALHEWTSRNGVPLLVGCDAVLPNEGPPITWTNYSAALLIPPRGSEQPERHYKQRLFPICETIPWPHTFVHERIKDWVDSFSSQHTYAWRTPGSEQTIFRLKQAATAPLRYTVAMCVEICYAKPCGIFLKSKQGLKPIDFLVNISNEALFQRNRALVFEAAMSSLRAVEGRIGIARSSNTGISGFVKPTGEMYGEVRNDRGEVWTGLGAPELPRIARLLEYRRAHAEEIGKDPAVTQYVRDEIAAIEAFRRKAGITGQSTQTVYVDSRRTLYSRIGDVLPWTLVLFTSGALLGQLAQELTGRALLLRRS